MRETVSSLLGGAAKHVYIDTAHFLDFVVQACQGHRDLSAFATALKTGYAFANSWGRLLFLSAIEHCLRRYKKVKLDWFMSKDTAHTILRAEVDFWYD